MVLIKQLNFLKHYCWLFSVKCGSDYSRILYRQSLTNPALIARRTHFIGLLHNHIPGISVHFSIPIRFSHAAFHSGIIQNGLPCIPNFLWVLFLLHRRVCQIALWHYCWDFCIPLHLIQQHRHLSWLASCFITTPCCIKWNRSGYWGDRHDGRNIRQLSFSYHDFPIVWEGLSVLTTVCLMVSVKCHTLICKRCLLVCPRQFILRMMVFSLIDSSSTP